MDIRAIRKKTTRYIIGLMSGSSCDGIDAALVRIKGCGQDCYVKLMKFRKVEFDPALQARLLVPHIDAREVCLLNFELGEQFGAAAQAMILEARDEGLCDVDFVASHGHTLAHVPPRGNKKVGTLQVGEPAVIAERTRVPVVSDFRARDMAAGGQGAPLVAYADWLLFRREDRNVVCLNIGGIANMTVVTPELDNVVAFDTGPANMAIDGAVRLLTRGAQSIDTDGRAAARGVVIDEFLEYLLDHPFFDHVPPKSTGREEFGPEVYLRDALAARKNKSFEDLICTVTTAVAYSIIRAYTRFVKPQFDISRLVVSGGGARNRTLMKSLKRGFSDTVLRTSEDYGIPSKAREALAFAILGNETVCGEPGNVPQATGASRRVILGNITSG
jgi:anhydro-N-acetylmuramic acid kinase